MASYAAIEVSNAASPGAQYGAQNPDYAATTWPESGAQRRTMRGTSLWEPRPRHESCICSNGAASTCQPTSCVRIEPRDDSDGADPDAFIQLGIPLPGFPTASRFMGRQSKGYAMRGGFSRKLSAERAGAGKEAQTCRLPCCREPRSRGCSNLARMARRSGRVFGGVYSLRGCSFYDAFRHYPMFAGAVCV